MNLLARLRYWHDNRCSALGTVRWLKKRKITPLTLVDAGANESQWMKHLAYEWPWAKVISFEPQPKCLPMGTVHRVALGKTSSRGNLSYASFAGGKPTNANLVECPSGAVEVHRLDEYAAEFESPAVLKVDCEDHTLNALIGAEHCLDRFCCVVAEVWDDIFDYSTMNNHQEIHSFMAEQGFDRAMTVGAIPWLTSVSQTDVLFWKGK